MAILGYWIDSNFHMNERLLVCYPFSDCQHTSDEIQHITLQGLVDMGISESVGDVWEHIHGCTPDEGSNILKAWRIFEGSGCVCHRANNCLKDAIKEGDVCDVVKKVKAVCSHFHRSVKVSLLFDLLLNIHDSNFKLCREIESCTRSKKKWG